MMIDIHSHLLPGIDDGSTSLDESIEIIKEGIKFGVTDIIVTPHFIYGSTYNSDNNIKKCLFKELESRVKNEKLNISLYLGNEIYADKDLISFIEKGLAVPLNNSKYLLFEIPLNSDFPMLNNVIFEIQSKGYIPVLAHPERYATFKKNPLLINELANRGVLFQSNIGSFSGMYGKSAKKLVRLLLKHQIITFLGSDVHRMNNTIYPNIPELEKYIHKMCSREYSEQILYKNAQKLLINESIVVDSTSLSKGIFNSIK